MAVASSTAEPQTIVNKRAIPAWALSCGVHVVVMIVLAVLLQSVPPTEKGMEGDRGVSIVLAKTTAKNTEYYQETKAEQAQKSAAKAQQSLPPAPKQQKEQLLPNIKLPGAATGAVNSENLKLPDLVGTGRRQAVLPGQGTAEILAQDAKSRRKGPTGATTKVSIFGSAAATGRSFVFVIDRSKSMGSEGLGALEAAGKELTKGLKSLKSYHRFQVIAYNQRCTYLEGTGLLTAQADRIGKVDNWLKQLPAFGATEHTNGLVSAIRLKPDVIFLLTDGGVPELDSVQLRRIRQYAEGKISIHSIQFGSGPNQDDDSFLKQLSQQNAGSFRYVDMSKWKTD